MQSSAAPDATSSRIWRLGFTLPLVTLIVLMVELTLRFAPIEWFTFRAWEGLKLDRAPNAAFLPNRNYHNDAVYGDLAAFGNLPRLRQYRAETFTTDQYGYRNLPRDWSSEPPAALLMGTSFSVSPGMNDDETLSAQLGALSGRAVYNLAGYADEITIERLHSIASRLGFQHGVVFVEYLERFDLPPPVLAPSGLLGQCGPGYGEPCDPASLLSARLRSLRQVSPLQIVTERAMKGLENDWLLPNPYARRVVQAPLVNGEMMLFLPEEIERYGQLQSESFAAAERSADYFNSFSEQLDREGLKLIVLLVPNKFTVYRPLLENRADSGPESTPYLVRLELRLRELGIPVVNLLPSFQARAATDLRSGQYIYWRDDTHWNPLGIQFAAQELLKAWNP